MIRHGCHADGGMLRQAGRDLGPVVFLTSHLPKPKSDGDKALRKAGIDGFFDAIEMLSHSGQERLTRYAQGRHHGEPLPGFWTEDDIASFRSQIES